MVVPFAGIELLNLFLQIGELLVYFMQFYPIWATWLKAHSFETICTKGKH